MHLASAVLREFLEIECCETACDAGPAPMVEPAPAPKPARIRRLRLVEPAEPPPEAVAPPSNYVVIDRSGAEMDRFPDVVTAKRWLDRSKTGRKLVRLSDGVVLSHRDTPIDKATMRWFQKMLGESGEPV